MEYLDMFDPPLARQMLQDVVAEIERTGTDLTPENILKYESLAVRICTQLKDNLCEAMYDACKQVLDDYVTSTVLPTVAMKPNDELKLRAIVRSWNTHNIIVRSFSKILNVLEAYIAYHEHLTVDQLGLTSFLEVFESFGVDAILSMVKQEREGAQIDRAFVKNVLNILLGAPTGKMKNDFEAAMIPEAVASFRGKIRGHFEESMLTDTQAYYSLKASKWMSEDSCLDYMLKAEGCMKKEKDNMSHFLDVGLVTNILKIVENNLYNNQLLENEQSGFLALLRDDKVKDLSQMYELFSRSPKGLEPVIETFQKHVTAEGTHLMQNARSMASGKAGRSRGLGEQGMKLVKLHAKFMACVRDCFANNPLLLKGLEEAFEVVSNFGVTSKLVDSDYLGADLLASCCDDVILTKRLSEKLTDDAIESTFDMVVKVLAYVKDRDIFAEFYRKKLSRRLLFDKSANNVHEVSFLSKLKQQFGAPFTSKMERMVTDFILSKEEMSLFKEYIKINPSMNPGVDFTVTVLTTNSWPTLKYSDLSLPTEMAKCVQVFNDYNKDKNGDRKLTWIYSLGTCKISGMFEHSTIELTVGTYQAAALLLFNASDRLSFSEISSQLNLDRDDLTRVLQSLSCGKYNILTKEPNNKTVSPSDHFEFNSKFTDRMKRIKVPLLPPVDDRKKTAESTVNNRPFVLKCYIVRFMKVQKVITHDQLALECTKQAPKFNFKPKMSEIKKLIEDLIDHDILRRDEKDLNKYYFVA